MRGLLLAFLLLASLLLGWFFLGLSGGSGPWGARLFLGLALTLLAHLQNAHLGQSQGTASFGPAVLGLQDLDAFGATEDVARPLQRILAAKAFVNRHGRIPSVVI